MQAPVTAPAALAAPQAAAPQAAAPVPRAAASRRNSTAPPLPFVKLSTQLSLLELVEDVTVIQTALERLGLA